MKSYLNISASCPETQLPLEIENFLLILQDFINGDVKETALIKKATHDIDRFIYEQEDPYTNCLLIKLCTILKDEFVKFKRFIRDLPEVLNKSLKKRNLINFFYRIKLLFERYSSIQKFKNVEPILPQEFASCVSDPLKEFPVRSEESGYAFFVSRKEIASIVSSSGFN